MSYIILLALIIQLLVSVGVFALLVYVARFLVRNFELSSRFKNSRFSNLQEYFPSEEIFSLKHVFYLIMILIFIFISLYVIFDWSEGGYILILDILVSVYLAVNAGRDSIKDKIILFLLVPFGSLSGILFSESLIYFLDLIHIIGYIYFINVYYRKFVKFSENNGLGITIMLLFGIILVSFLFTILAEGVSPLDSATMVSNAFTSNSFEASGNSVLGKLNSLVLAWGGFILSGVGTATLAVSMVMRHVNRRFDDVENLVKRKKKEK